MVFRRVPVKYERGALLRTPLDNFYYEIPQIKKLREWKFSFSEFWFRQRDLKARQTDKRLSTHTCPCYFISPTIFAVKCKFIRSQKNQSAQKNIRP